MSQIYIVFLGNSVDSESVQRKKKLGNKETDYLKVTQGKPCICDIGLEPVQVSGKQ